MSVELLGNEKQLSMRWQKNKMLLNFIILSHLAKQCMREFIFAQTKGTAERKGYDSCLSYHF